MRTRKTITVIRICLAFVGIWVLVEPIRDTGGSSAYHRGQTLGRASIALACLVAAVPWGRPRGPNRDEDEPL